ncbi:catechol-2,3-dioxygenase [Bacillus tianshenii]|uniref:Catechol-2,3-dioxygenase n=1 Tax=Sutcliffiella tianshenii TaxID=1463404 RepID=A0ABS2NYK5_9BACI|nr:VOC family protein [Bacillus tianshenii]MBM7619725.1 catechol-2,3-dioxygenase [Bacillus tianshenii]
MIKRVGTTYIPVKDPETASNWYQETVGAVENFRNEDKAIMDFADQSFFLVKAKPAERMGFKDIHGNLHFAMTFEVDGYQELSALHTFLKGKGVEVGEIEDRGHAGNNFVFYDLDGNPFDVWSELSPKFKERNQIGSSSF